jgi:hypothetical protein
MVRLLAAVHLVGLGLLAGVSVSSTSSLDARAVPCRYIVDYTRFPYFGSSQPENRYRQVLGVIAVPPAYLGRMVATGERPWAYWQKAGLVIRATGEPVTVTVPAIWRTRAAIIWGNGGGTASHLDIEGCRTASKVPAGRLGNAYAGGFYLRPPSACLPLIFTVGSRSATVRFGLGKRCPA